MKLEPLDPAIAALLAPEREIPRVTDAAVDAALARAMERGDVLLSTAPPGGFDLPHARGFGSKALAASVAGGALVGSLVTYALLGPRREADAPAPPASSSASAPIAPPSAPTADPGPLPIPLSALPAESERPTSTHASSEPPRPSNDIARERELVDAARAALAKGHVDEASRLLREHDTQFPRGQLGEEREALQIIALARGGKKDEGRARLASFRRSHGTSPLLPMLEAEVGAADAGP